jgi:LacI family transcriptional regulator
MPVTPVTIRDVAAAAGVSVATASRVLSGARRVSADREAAVLEASERLGYRANAVARSLRTRSTATVGMVVPGISNPYFPYLVEAVERQLSATGRELLLCDSQQDITIEAARVRALLDRQVDGLLFIPCDRHDSGAILSEAAAQVPVVQMDRYVEDVDVDFVGVDNTAAIHAIVDHLWATGCRTFAFAGSQPVDTSAGLRLAAYGDAVRGLDAASADRILLGDYSLAWGSQVTQHLLAHGRLPDAIICAADIIALGVIAALSAVGVRVPDEVAVTGFDDIGFAAVSAPPLTTVRQPADAIGAEAVRLLAEQQAGTRGAPRHRTLVAELTVRASTRDPQP